MISVSSESVLNVSTVFIIISDRQASANRVDPDENAVSYQGLRCLPLFQQFLDIILGSKFYLFKF